MNGYPHHGKMYGFYDPTDGTGKCAEPFNKNFMADLRRRRGARQQAFNAYRKQLNPNGLFCNDHLCQLLEQ